MCDRAPIKIFQRKAQRRPLPLHHRRIVLVSFLPRPTAHPRDSRAAAAATPEFICIHEYISVFSNQAARCRRRRARRAIVLPLSLSLSLSLSARHSRRALPPRDLAPSRAALARLPLVYDDDGDLGSLLRRVVLRVHYPSIDLPPSHTARVYAHVFCTRPDTGVREVWWFFETAHSARIGERRESRDVYGAAINESTLFRRFDDLG